MAKGADIHEILNDSEFITAWKNAMIDTMLVMHPDWDTDKMVDDLNKMIIESLQLPSVTMDNNYTGERRDTNLLSVFDWAIRRRPIIAGNATFYKNQNEAINPIAKMLDGFLIKRKDIKKRMFAIKDTESDRYQDLDRGQVNQKILANSYYGGSGMPRAAFYSQWSGPATTGTAQSVISTTEVLFESFLANNLKFIDINECFYYMNMILKLRPDEIKDWIVPVSESELFERIQGMFYDDIYEDEFEPLIRRYIHNLTVSQRTRIFYVFNIFEFTKRHSKVKKLFDDIFESVVNLEYVDRTLDIPLKYASEIKGDTEKDQVDNYNKFVNTQYFMNPNDPPESIKETLKKLSKYYMDYVYIPYMGIDRIWRLKFFPRQTVCVVDTDSNILALDEWIEFWEDELKKSDYGRDNEHNRFIIVNTLAYCISDAVKDVLNEYGLNSNIPDEYRPRFSMKNEFYFDKLIIGQKKKRYISSIKLREGNLLDPYDADVKGFEFMKAETSETAKKRFDKIVKDHILESPMPNIPAILGELRAFANDIMESIQNRELTYLPLGNAKEMEAYKKPYSQQSVRGMIAWNFLNPSNQISVPAKVSILKLNIFDLNDIKELAATHPREYEIIKTKIFESPIQEIASKGLQVLSIPENAQIPEWCEPYIDYNTVVNNILGRFKGVTDVFGINSPEVGKQIKSVNRKTKKFTNIVRF